ncbi:MAG: DUF4242 domain-containing protein [Planctomycetes bacterium]|nr:DUF4242 domain-containing protein [Planctomycetota bacterium]
MPLFMDAHRNLKGATLEDVKKNHLSDLDAQDKYGVKYLKFWFNEAAQTVFCLCTGPNQEACVAVHKAAHGNVAERIIEVQDSVFEAFMGGGKETEIGCALNPQGELDTAFRAILFTDIQGSTRMTQTRGDTAAMTLVRAHNDIVRRALRDTGGREVKHTGDGIMASFFSVPEGIRCAVCIQREIARHNQRAPADALHVRIGLSAGEPVVEGGDLFGSAVQLARRVCDYAHAGQVLVSNLVRDLIDGKDTEFIALGEAELKGFDKPERIHEVRWA